MESYINYDPSYDQAINSFAFILKSDTIILIDETGFKYKGELIEDSGEVYKLFKEFLQSAQLLEKETKYTEEQVREAIYMAREFKEYEWKDGERIAVRYKTDEIIQSIKND
jgi:hypothetical protein